MSAHVEDQMTAVLEEIQILQKKLTALEKKKQEAIANGKIALAQKFMIEVSSLSPISHTISATHSHSAARFSSPHLSSPLLTSPLLSSPLLTSPHLTSPHLSSPLLCRKGSSEEILIIRKMKSKISKERNIF
jgi:hypothetical protein